MLCKTVAGLFLIALIDFYVHSKIVGKNEKEVIYNLVTVTVSASAVSVKIKSFSLRGSNQIDFMLKNTIYDTNIDSGYCHNVFSY